MAPDFIDKLFRAVQVDLSISNSSLSLPVYLLR